ncbi:hypothetical protein [Sphingobium cupriresistens]|uniref:hypothetical protein n=1 Tax=Sphingobium cupriresistens TaxID=1132417 RepID=UPI003BADCC17
MVDNLMLQQLHGAAPAEQKVVRARCSQDACRHEWIAAHLPMPLEKAAMLMQRAACPKCADDRPVVAHG